MANLDRKDVYKLIDSERDYQDKTSSNWEHKSKPSFEAELLLIEEYVKKARTHYVNHNNNDHSLNQLRKVAGVIVRAFENQPKYLSREYCDEQKFPK